MVSQRVRGSGSVCGRLPYIHSPQRGLHPPQMHSQHYVLSAYKDGVRIYPLMKCVKCYLASSLKNVVCLEVREVVVWVLP